MTALHQASGVLTDGSRYVATLQSLEVTAADGQPLASFAAAEFKTVHRDGGKLTFHRFNDRPIILTLPSEEAAAALQSVFSGGSPTALQPAAAPALGPETAGVIFDKKDQMEAILPWILPFERLLAVFDLKGGGTGFVAITHKRLLFYDKAFTSKRKALTSVPFSKVSAVSSIDDRGMMQFNWAVTGTLVIKTGSEEYEFEFRGGDKAHTAYQLIMRELLQAEMD